MWRDNVYPEVYDDILARPHVLIAGATGSGKSVLLNGLIASAAVDGASFVMIDPKKVELYQWKDHPSVVRYEDTVKGSVEALKAVLRLIEKRYQDCRRIGLVQSRSKHLYVCIDELADLMTTAKRDVLPLLQRIGQIGRGANVHLIGCTQCVNTTVLPTQLLVNFDCRICLKVATAHHSRMIIGQAGAELFPIPCVDGKADMWVSLPDGLHRIAVPMITHEDIVYEIRKRYAYVRGSR